MDSGYMKVQDNNEALFDGSKYRSIVGVFLHISACARLDIAASAAILGRKVEAPTQAGYVAVKCVIRYLKSSRSWCLLNDKADSGLSSYTDAD